MNEMSDRFMAGQLRPDTKSSLLIKPQISHKKRNYKEAFNAISSGPQTLKDLDQDSKKTCFN